MQDLNAFVIFAAVVDAGSFSRAAERLGISKALASRDVAELERSLGVRLLNRTTRKLGLTAAGAVFHERCRELIAHAESARVELEQFRTAPGGPIRVSAAISFGRLHLVDAIGAFLERYPNVTVELDLSERFADLVSDGADLVIRQADEPRLHALVARQLAPLRWVLCASPAYLARRPSPVMPADLAAHQCITYLSNARSEWRFTAPGTAAATVRVAGPCRASNADGVVRAALAGLGIAAVPSFAAGEPLRDGRLVRLLPEWSLPEQVLYAAWLPNPHMAQRVQTFVRFLGERFGSEPPWDRDLPVAQS
jgi:LysR family transcriptional regulator for bpeEF and oprC